jgi:hypothetical protein
MINCVYRFMDSNLWVGTQEINIEGKQHTMIVLTISNEDYDES